MSSSASQHDTSVRLESQEMNRCFQKGEFDFVEFRSFEYCYISFGSIRLG